MCKQDQRGFTLLEVLVALVIFSMISAASYQILRSLSQSQRVLAESAQHRLMLDKALLLLREDLRQVLGRSSREGLGFTRRPAMSGNVNEALEFTRTGFDYDQNGLGLRRVVYAMVEREGVQGLVRVVSNAPDVSPQTPMFEQLVLPELEDFQVRFADDNGIWHQQWPPVAEGDTISDEQLVELPKALLVSLTVNEDLSLDQFINLQ